MNYDRPLLEELAAQFVLGTLRGSARQRFVRLCAQNVTARAAVRRWEDHLMGLVAQIKPVTPPQQVWRNIESRLGMQTAPKRWFFASWSQRWRWAMAASAATIAIVAGVVVTQPQPAQIIAVIAESNQSELWNVRLRSDRSAIVIEASKRVKLDAEHAYELWALPESGAPPVSLGVLPNRGMATLALSIAQQAALKGASKIAVSLEPLGGSPTGAPTGPVLHVTEIARVLG